MGSFEFVPVGLEVVGISLVRSGDVGFFRVPYRSLGSFVFIWFSPWRSLGSSGVIGLTMVRPRGRWVHQGSFGSLWFVQVCLGVVWFIRVRSSRPRVHSGVFRWA